MFRFVFILKQIKCRTASFKKKKNKKIIKINSLLLGSLQVWSRQFDFSRQVSGQISILNDDNREQALTTSARRTQPQRTGSLHLDAAVQISLSGCRIFCFHEAENGDACGCRDRTTTVNKKPPQELPGCETDGCVYLFLSSESPASPSPCACGGTLKVVRGALHAGVTHGGARTCSLRGRCMERRRGRRTTARLRREAGRSGR